MTAGKLYACVMLTLWRMNDRHDWHLVPLAGNDA